MRSESFHLTKIFIYFADFAHAHTHAHMQASKQASKQASWPGQQSIFIHNAYVSNSIFRSTFQDGK